MIIMFKRQNVKVMIVLVILAAMVWAISSGFQSTHETLQQEAQMVLAENQIPKAKNRSVKQPLAQPIIINQTTPTVAENISQESNEMTENIVSVLSLRMERNQQHSQQQEMLENIIANDKISAEAKTEAERRLLTLAETSAMELQAETLLQTKGYQNIIVMIDFDNATVYTTDDLNDSDYAKIGDLVHKSTNFTLEQIVIIPK